MTNIDDWKCSDEYCSPFLIPKDDVLEAVAKNNHAQGLSDVTVSAAQGRFLNLLAKTQKAKRILEVLDDMARPRADGGRLITLELDEHYAKLGDAIIVDNFVRYGEVANPVEQSDSTDGVRRLSAAIKDDDEAEATTISTVGDKSYDGLLYAFKK